MLRGSHFPRSAAEGGCDMNIYRVLCDRIGTSEARVGGRTAHPRRQRQATRFLTLACGGRARVLASGRVGSGGGDGGITVPTVSSSVHYPQRAVSGGTTDRRGPDTRSSLDKRRTRCAWRGGRCARHPTGDCNDYESARLLACWRSSVSAASQSSNASPSARFAVVCP